MVVKIEKGKYKRLLQVYNMDTYPRTVGFPNQFFVNNYDDFWKFFDFTRGNGVCFTSSNSYPKSVQRHRKKIPIIISVNNIFSDFDSVNKPENALRDNRRMVNFMIDEELADISGYSGSKGCCNYIPLKPLKFKYHTNGESARSLKRLVWGVHLWFEKKFKMTTMDKVVMKDPKRLCRMYYSPHCNMQGELNGRHCYPFTTEQALDWNITDIVDYSYDPKFHIPITEGKRLTIFELADHLSIDFEEIESENRFSDIEKGDIKDLPDEDTYMILAMLEKLKPCIVNALKGINPDHPIRFALACFMKRMNIPIDKAERHYVNIANHFNYVDAHNDDERWIQFENIYNPSNNYNSEPSCNNLIRDKYCIGESCERFHKEWKGYESRSLQK